MNKNTSILSIITLVFGIGCASEERVDLAAEVLSMSMSDAVQYGTIREGTNGKTFHFKDADWSGEVRGDVIRGGSGQEDWDLNLELASFGDEDIAFTGDMQLVTSSDLELGFETIYLTGVVESSSSKSTEVDLQIEFTETEYSYEVSWVGEINGSRVGGSVLEREDIEEGYDDCRTPVGVDCG